MSVHLQGRVTPDEVEDMAGMFLLVSFCMFHSVPEHVIADMYSSGCVFAPTPVKMCVPPKKEPEVQTN